MRVWSSRTRVGRGRPVSAANTESVVERRRFNASRTMKARRTGSITRSHLVRNTDFVDFTRARRRSWRMVGATEETPMAYQSIEVRKLTPTIGAEIFGVDLGQPLGNQQFQEV